MLVFLMFRAVPWCISALLGHTLQSECHACFRSSWQLAPMCSR